MDHQVTITLTEQEYAALSAKAARRGKPIEVIAREAIVPRVETARPTKPADKYDALHKLLRRKGIIMNIPTGKPLSPEEKRELERLAHLFSGGMLASDIVIEDRGPR